jgi:hypothetical protein
MPKFWIGLASLLILFTTYTVLWILYPHQVKTADFYTSSILFSLSLAMLLSPFFTLSTKNTESKQLVSVGPLILISIILIAISSMSIYFIFIGDNANAMLSNVIYIGFFLTSFAVMQFSKSIHDSILHGRSKNSKHINWAFNLSLLAKQSKNSETKLALEKISEELRYHPFDSVEKLNIDNSINKLIYEITESIKYNPSSDLINDLNNLNSFFEHRNEEIKNLRTKI